jgi:hypothetical protein
MKCFHVGDHRTVPVVLRASDEDARRISTFAPMTNDVGQANFVRSIVEVAR